MQSTTAKKRVNRSRMRPKKTTGIIVEQHSDAKGFSEPLSRLGELPSGILGSYYNLLNGKSASSRYYLERLGNLFHESEESPRTIITRPRWQNRHGINHEAIYRNGIAAPLLLYKEKLRDETSLLWVHTTRVMALSKDTEQPSPHDQEVVIIAASIELEARRDRGFITHIDILKSASKEAQEAESPLSVPVDRIEHTFPDHKATSIVKNTHFKSDLLFGIRADGGGKFFWLEHDRHSEDMEPTKSLVRMSWLKKILMMNAISTGQEPRYRSYFNIPNLRLLATFQGPHRQAHFNRMVKAYARYPTMFVSTVVPPIDFVMTPRILPELYNEPVWMRHDGTLFSLREEVM